MKVKPATREPVPSTKRRPMTWKRKCEVLLVDALCFQCQDSLAIAGVEYDHFIPLYMGGKDEPENIVPLCPKCHKKKTAMDKKAIAKDKRIHGLTKTKKKKIPGRKLSETYREQKAFKERMENG